MVRDRRRQPDRTDDFLRSYRRILDRLEQTIPGEPERIRTFLGSVVVRLLRDAFIERTTGLEVQSSVSGEHSVPEEAIALIQDELIRPFELAAKEDGLRSRSMAIDPELLSRLHEAQLSRRHEKGCYYTPKTIVGFMVRQALQYHLERALPDEDHGALKRLVWRLDSSGLREPLSALERVDRVRVCDPACGCGAFLLGALELLLRLRRCLSAVVGMGSFSSHRTGIEILRRNLYGVDLDAEAVEIARLRLWLSIVADMDRNVEGEPVHWTASAEPPSTRGEDSSFAQHRWPPLAGVPREGGGSPFADNLRVGESLVGIDWRATFQEPFDDGGFDVVLMNPPYLLANHVAGDARESFRAYTNRLRRRFGFVDDLYVHFLHLGLALLKEGGTQCAITSSSFLTNARQEPLRRELLRHSPRLILPIGPRIFPAVVYSAITVVQKGPPAPGHLIRYARLQDEGTAALDNPGLLERLFLAVPVEEYEKAFGAVFFEPTPAKRCLFGTLLAHDLRGPDPDEPAWPDERGEPSPTRAAAPAGSAVPSITTSAGARSAGNRRFVRLAVVAPALDTGIHSGNVRHRLFFRDLVPGRDLHRLLQGTQIVRYGVWWENPEARYRYVDVSYTPKPELRGIGRGGKPSGRGEYWHFSGAKENHHVPERLLMRQTGDEPFVGHLFQGEERVYTDNTLHTLLLTEQGRRLGLTYRYLLALLNSATLRWVYRALAQEEGRTLAQVKIALVNRLPIAVPTEQERVQLEAAVARIQSILQRHGLPLDPAADLEVKAIQGEIDRRVAELYGLPETASP